jgi:hypothetical protein
MASSMAGDTLSGVNRIVSPLNGDRSAINGSECVLSNVSNFFRQIVVNDNLMTGSAQRSAKHHVFANVGTTLVIASVLKPRSRESGHDVGAHQHDGRAHRVHRLQPVRVWPCLDTLPIALCRKQQSRIAHHAIARDDRPIVCGHSYCRISRERHIRVEPEHVCRAESNGRVQHMLSTDVHIGGRRIAHHH